jgi:hypothetical protein
VTYAIARSGGVASFTIYIFVTVLATLTAEDQRAEAAPAAAPVPELALEEVVAPPPVVVAVPGVCIYPFLLPVCQPILGLVIYSMYKMKRWERSSTRVRACESIDCAVRAVSRRIFS